MQRRVLGIAVGLSAVLAMALPGQAAAQRRTELAVHDQPACSSKHRMGLDNARNFERWLGRRPDRVLDFAWFETWDNIVRSSSLLPGCWKGAGYDRLTFSVPMLPNDKVSTLEQGAAGAYDDKFRQIGAALVAKGYPDAIIRLGWEFNIAAFPWAAAKNPQAFVAYWRRIVGVMRSVPGARFRFDWNPTLDAAWAYPGRIAPALVYPGDDYVDIIGMDVYNESWKPANTVQPQRWRDMVERPYGLRWQRDFAAQHGKPISFPEWGTGTRPDGHGAGDDPFFIEQMARWIAANDVVYQGYWDEEATTFDAKLSNGRQPASADAYRRAFGGRGRGDASEGRRSHRRRGRH